MEFPKITSDLLSSELEFSFSRSGGPGGQNVNKVNTKVTLRWDVANSQLLDEEQKALLLKKLATRLTKEGELVLTSQEGRSQLTNKEDALTKLDELLTKAFTKKKKRKPTKPTRSSVQKRLDEKKKVAEKKRRRGEW